MSWRARVSRIPCLTASAVAAFGAACSGASDGPLRAVDTGVASIHVEHVFLMGRATCDAAYRPVDYDRATQRVSRGACVAAIPDADAGATTTEPATSTVLTSEQAHVVEDVIATVTYVEDGPSDGIDGEEWYLTTYDAAGARVGKYSARRINGTPFPRAERVRDLYDALRRY